MIARTRALALALALALAALGALAAAPAGAEFGLKGLSFEFTQDAEGTPATQAGAHPYAFANTLEVNTTTDPVLGEVPEDAIKDLRIELPVGMAGNPTAVPPCSSADFSDITAAHPFGNCADTAAIGLATVRVGNGFSAPTVKSYPVYNLAPPPGKVAKIGFVVLGAAVTAVLEIEPDPPYRVIARLDNVPQPVRFYGSRVEVWGNPASPEHNAARGGCGYTPEADLCPVSIEEKPFLVMPRSCAGPLAGSFAANSWQDPATVLEYPLAWTYGMSNCAALGLTTTISSQATTRAAGAASGLAFELDVTDPGLSDPDSHAGSDIKKAVVTLPAGMTVNPGVAEGLATCSQAELARESAFSAPGAGCPQASKLGEVEVQTPLLEGKLLRGQVYAATQDENPFHTMIALYMVIKDPELGILVKVPGKVEPDPATGQLVTTFGEAPYEIPQVPFSHLRFRFREGARAPLITPSTCGTFETKAIFTPWANPAAPRTSTATFTIDQGCPAGPTPPFAPGFEAGSQNNDAGAYSPFLMRLTRPDGAQDMTRFDAVLPPGVLAKIAGLSHCADAQIAAAKARDGRSELAAPSCPESSRIGRTLAGAGVGSALTYVPGSLYLAGPFAGHPLSVVAITPALAGPYDAGTVVVREALALDPDSGQAIVDGSASDPIPHILKGIPLKLRELRVYADRPGFTVNPTSCDPLSAHATLFGSGADPFSAADDAPVALRARYQAASCRALAFKPKLRLRLTGATRRSGNPALRATLIPRAGDANLAGAVVALPKSQFIDNAHINNPCTREQFAAAACPKGSVLGRARAFSPLLDQPLEGPVYFRSNGGQRDLPDVVADLGGQFRFTLVIAVLSSEKTGRITTRVLNAPDAPVSKVVLRLAGGKRGLLENSESLCRSPQRASLRLIGQNGRLHRTRPLVKTSCHKKKQRPKGAKRR